MSPQAKETKAKIGKWDYIKLKSLIQQGNHQQNKKGHVLNGRRYLQVIDLIRD